MQEILCVLQKNLDPLGEGRANFIKTGQVLPALILEKEGTEALLRIANTTLQAKVPEDIPVLTKIWLRVENYQDGQVLLRNLGPDNYSPWGLADTPAMKNLIETWQNLGVPIEQKPLQEIAAYLTSHPNLTSASEITALIKTWFLNLPLADVFQQKLQTSMTALKFDNYLGTLYKLISGHEGEAASRFRGLWEQIPEGKNLNREIMYKQIQDLGLDLENKLAKGMEDSHLSWRAVLNELLNKGELVQGQQEAIRQGINLLEQTAWDFSVLGFLHFFLPVKERNRYFWIEWEQKAINPSVPEHYNLRLTVPTENLGTFTVVLQFTGKWRGKVSNHDSNSLALLEKHWSELDFTEQSGNWVFTTESAAAETLSQTEPLRIKQIDIEA